MIVKTKETGMDRPRSPRFLQGGISKTWDKVMRSSPERAQAALTSAQRSVTTSYADI